MDPEKKSRNAFSKGIKAGAATAAKRNAGEFDGLLGSLKQSQSLLLSDLIADIRDVVLDWCQDEKLARVLLVEREPASGYRNVQSVPPDVELALRLLGAVASAMRCTPEKAAKLFLGSRDAARQSGTRLPRRPEVSAWITRAIRKNPSVKSPDLWAVAPDWITEQISIGRFAKRVTKARQSLKEDASK